MQTEQSTYEIKQRVYSGGSPADEGTTWVETPNPRWTWERERGRKEIERERERERALQPLVFIRVGRLEKRVILSFGKLNLVIRRRPLCTLGIRFGSERNSIPSTG